jgi:protein SCO1/2
MLLAASVLGIGVLLAACGTPGDGSEATPPPPSRTGAATIAPSGSRTPAPTAPYPVHRSGVQWRGRTVPQALAKPDFVLEDTHGHDFAFRGETDGEVTLLYFGYTYCPDLCPTHLADLASVLGRNPELADAVNVVFVSVDPDRDTGERIEYWLGLFQANFIGLRGPLDETVAASRAALGGMYVPIEKLYYGGEGEYAMTHSSIVVAYGRDNRARVVFPPGTTQGDYEADLRKLTGIDGG